MDAMRGWMHGWMGGWMDGWMDGWMGGWVNRGMGGWIDERMNGRAFQSEMPRTQSTYSIPEPSSCYDTYMYMTSRKSAQASSRPTFSPECREMLLPRNCTVLLW